MGGLRTEGASHRCGEDGDAAEEPGDVGTSGVQQPWQVEGAVAVLDVGHCKGESLEVLGKGQVLSECADAFIGGEVGEDRDLAVMAETQCSSTSRHGGRRCPDCCSPPGPSRRIPICHHRWWRACRARPNTNADLTMPKITGPNIAEHVAAQEEAVFAAAIRLFAERGVTNVSTGDIANEVGLARTSLYRYFPTKASIVFRWFEMAMIPLIDASIAIAADSTRPSLKLERWFDLQLDFLADPDNHAMIRASLGIDDMPDDIRTAIGRRHRDLYATLHSILDTAKIPDETTRSRVLLIAGLPRHLNDLTNQGIPLRLARRELHRASTAIAWHHSALDTPD